MPAWLEATVTERARASCKSSPNTGLGSPNKPLEGVAHNEKGGPAGANTELSNEEYEGSVVTVEDMTADEMTETDEQVFPDAVVESTVSEVTATVAGTEMTRRLLRCLPAEMA